MIVQFARRLHGSRERVIYAGEFVTEIILYVIIALDDNNTDTELGPR